MFKANDEQIEMLVNSLQQTQSSHSNQISQYIDEGESLEFYCGVITGLLISHQLLKTHKEDLAYWLSVAAALASEQYMKIKPGEEMPFPDLIDTEE